MPPASSRVRRGARSRPGAHGRRQRDHGRARRERLRKGLARGGTAAQWPPKDVEYRSLYLRPRRKISAEPELLDPEHAAPDGFYQAPLTVTDEVEIISWSTAPFEEDAELIGHGAAHLFAEIDQPDTNFIMRLWDVASDGSRQLITTGFLKASHRELDEPTTEGNPYHPHTPIVK